MKARYLADVIEIGKAFQRSVRLEKDTERDEGESEYILTSTGARDAQEGRGQSRRFVDRASLDTYRPVWSREIGLCSLSRSIVLLGGAPSKYAFKQLREVEPRLAEKLSGFGLRPTAKRFLPVLLTARCAPAVKCLAEALRNALASLPRQKAGPLIVELSRYCTSADSSARGGHPCV